MDIPHTQQKAVVLVLPTIIYIPRRPISRVFEVAEGGKKKEETTTGEEGVIEFENNVSHKFTHTSQNKRYDHVDLQS